MKTSRMEQLPAFFLGDLSLQPFSGENLMVARVVAPAGSVAPRHSHPHEQMCLVLSGRIRCSIGPEQQEIEPGAIIHFPSNVEHEVQFLEPTVMFDIFHPVREDFLKKLEEARQEA